MRRALLLALFTAIACPLYSQFLPDLQAKTPEEYDAYLDVLSGPVLEKGAAFERLFPNSTLLLPVYELIVHASMSLGDSHRALEAAKRGLSIAPDYPPLLVELADLSANTSGNLKDGEGAARRALSLLETIKAPRRVEAGVWVAAVSDLRARARAALGQLLFKRDDVAGAVEQFEAALKEPGPKDPALHYRLGRLYAAVGRKAESRNQLEQAARLGGSVLRERANAALADLR